MMPIAWRTCSRFDGDQDFVQVGRKQLPKMLLKKSSHCSKEKWRKGIVHISAIMSFGLKAFASWVPGIFLCFSFLPNIEYRAPVRFQIGFNFWKWKPPCQRFSEFANSCSAKCQRQKRWKANSGSSSGNIYWPRLQSSLNFIGLDTPVYVPPL